MPADPIAIDALLTYEVAEEGAAARLSFRDGNGETRTLEVPMEVLRQLTLSMPRIMQQALQARLHDPTMRFVHAVAAWQVERARDGSRCILTFTTPDHFCFAFCVEDGDLDKLSEAVSDYEIDAFPYGLHFH